MSKGEICKLMFPLKEISDECPYGESYNGCHSVEQISFQYTLTLEKL